MPLDCYLPCSSALMHSLVVSSLQKRKAWRPWLAEHDPLAYALGRFR
jgi:hypothetical protein